MGALTRQQAADLHAAFLGDLSARLAASDWTLWSAWDLDDGESPAVELLAAPTERALRQCGDDLGARLHAALRAAAAAGFDPVGAVGSDHPTMPLARLDDCLKAMDRGAEVVLGPAADGGYYLVAARARALSPVLFRGIEWSSDRVLEQTLARCAERGVAVELLEVGSDVDHPEDLDRLAGELSEQSGLCPRTEALLEGWRSP